LQLGFGLIGLLHALRLTRDRDRQLGVGLGAAQVLIGELVIVLVHLLARLVGLLLSELEVERGARDLLGADLRRGADGALGGV
jgi:hypothetical protein